VTPRSQLLKRQPHVLEERGLELVDEEGGGGLERAEQKQAVPNAGAVHHFLNPLGDVQEILACFRSDTDRVPAPLHRRPPIAGYASQIGCQFDHTSRRFWYRASAPPSKPRYPAGFRSSLRNHRYPPVRVSSDRSSHSSEKGSPHRRSCTRSELGS